MDATHPFNRLVFASPARLAMPIAVYPGLALTRARARDLVTHAPAQIEAQIALKERYGNAITLSAMDLSAEAEAFGCALYAPEDEVPSVTGRLVTTLEQAQALSVPQPGDKRTAVHLEVVRALRALPGPHLVLGGCIGPFSLAARLVGMSEAMELTVTDPGLMEQVLEKAARFLTAYARAFRDAGADGIIMAEPAAGLLSPRGMARYSSAWIRQIDQAACDASFGILLHNCGARLLHLPALLETGLKSFHFGAPMDLPAVLEKIPGDIAVCGNLDPAGVFCTRTPDEVAEATRALIARTASHRNHILSSGCDLPPNVPLANLDAFYAAFRER